MLREGEREAKIVRKGQGKDLDGKEVTGGGWSRGETKRDTLGLASSAGHGLDRWRSRGRTGTKEGAVGVDRRSSSAHIDVGLNFGGGSPPTGRAKDDVDRRTWRNGGNKHLACAGDATWT